MKSARPEFIFRISDDGERYTEINDLMAALAARRIKLDHDTLPVAQCLELAQELVTRDELIIGRKRPDVKGLVMFP